MKTRIRFTKPWYVGDTGTPATFKVVNEAGDVRDDLASATIRVVDTESGTVLVDDEDITQTSDGIFTWFFTSGETDSARLFACRLRITTDAGGVVVTPDVLGVVEENE